MKKLAAIGLLASFLAGCGETIETNFVVAKYSTPEVKAKVAGSLDKLLAKCPGLNKYSSDFLNIEASATSMMDFEGGIDISFQVSGNPTVIPKPLDRKAAHNRCYITIDAGLSKAYIAKTACHSLCGGAAQENDPNSMGKEFNI